MQSDPDTDLNAHTEPNSDPITDRVYHIDSKHNSEQHAKQIADAVCDSDSVFHCQPNLIPDPDAFYHSNADADAEFKSDCYANAIT